MTMENHFMQMLREINITSKRVDAIESAGRSSPMSTDKGREIEISNGSFIAVFDYYIVSPESGVVDDLDSLVFRNANVSLAGKKVLLRSAPGVTITVKDGTGNIDLTGAGGDAALDSPYKTLVLVFDIDLGVWIVYSSNLG